MILKTNRANIKSLYCIGETNIMQLYLNFFKNEAFCKSTVKFLKFLDFLPVLFQSR